MAVISEAEALKAMRGVESELDGSALQHVDWTKAQGKAAFQAIEDYYQATAKAGFGAAVETAVPGIFTNANKKRLGRWYFAHRFEVDI